MDFKKKYFLISPFILLLIVCPLVIQACVYIPAGTGCGGYGANTPGGTFFASSCRQCACWCGWVECCIPLVEHPKVAGRLSWLWDGRTCGCPTLFGQVPSGATQLTKEQMAQKIRDDLMAMKDKVIYKAGEYYLSPDGTLVTDCKGLVKYEWGKWSLNTGTPNNSFSFSDIVSSPYYGGIASYQSVNGEMISGLGLKPGDALISYMGVVEYNDQLVRLYHAGIYFENKAGLGFVAHNAGVGANLRIISVEGWFQYAGKTQGVLRAPY